MAVHTAVTNALADIDTVSLQRCQERLTAALQSQAQAQAQADVWQELATRRKSDIAALQEQVYELNARVVLLESVIANMKATANE